MAKQTQKPKIPQVTRIAFSKNLTSSKFKQLLEIAKRLGKIRHDIWDRYGSIQGYTLNFRVLRNRYVSEKRDFDLPARVWKETLKDVCDDIKARKAAGFKAVAQQVYRKLGKEAGFKRCMALHDGTWIFDPYLHRLMRKEIPRGRTWVDNQIVLDIQCYSHFVHGGKGWIAVTSLIPGKRIAIPLNTTQPINGTIRLILRDSKVEVHYTIPVEKRESSREYGEIGVDKGYSEVFVDSRGEFYGEALGSLLTQESDFLKVKNARRNKISAIAKKKPHKRYKIEQNNLGTRKSNRRKSKHTSRVKDVVYQATHDVIKTSSSVAHENLSVPMKSKKQYGKDTKRRLSGWVKGVIQTALEEVSQRYGVPLRKVNPAYTSQICSRCGLLGERKGERFYCTRAKCGNKMHADHNAALNILARTRDSEINLWMKAAEVKSILLEREQRLRLGPLNLDSSCHLPEV